MEVIVNSKNYWLAEIEPGSCFLMDNKVYMKSDKTSYYPAYWTHPTPEQDKTFCVCVNLKNGELLIIHQITRVKPLNLKMIEGE